MVKETIRKIEEQQKKYDEFTPQYQVGEQLKDICRRSPEQADLICKDLDNPDMSIEAAEKKIKEFADKHKKNGAACVPPRVAENILVEFYGLGAISKETEATRQDPVISLADFM